MGTGEEAIKAEAKRVLLIYRSNNCEFSGLSGILKLLHGKNRKLNFIGTQQKKQKKMLNLRGFIG